MDLLYLRAAELTCKKPTLLAVWDCGWKQAGTGAIAPSCVKCSPHLPACSTCPLHCPHAHQPPRPYLGPPLPSHPCAGTGYTPYGYDTHTHGTHTQEKPVPQPRVQVQVSLGITRGLPGGYPCHCLLIIIMPRPMPMTTGVAALISSAPGVMEGEKLR